MPKETVALRCVCAYGIFVELRGEDEYLGTAAFFDNEEVSETYGQQIRECPGYSVRKERR